MKTYIQRPVTVEAIELTWENEREIREFMREDFDQNEFMVVYVHNHDDTRWVEMHRNYFARIGIIGRRPSSSSDVEFFAVEKDWLVKDRGGLVNTLKPSEFRALYSDSAEEILNDLTAKENAPKPPKESDDASE